MTHTRYWAMSLSVAISGSLIAIDRFAFTPNDAIWIAFGLAIAAAVFSTTATAVALRRENHAFSGLSALSVLVAVWTILANRVFATPTALWIGLAGGVALLLVSLRALALHETTVERVVHALELDGAGEPLAIRPRSTGSTTVSPWTDQLRDSFEISRAMRSWMYWLTHTGIALAGAFVVLATFAWPVATQTVDPRWIAFGVGVAVASVALISLFERSLTARSDGQTPARLAAILLTGASVVVAAGLIVLMLELTGSDARWWAFALGDGLVGISLLASTIHELSSERVRHELEVAHATAPTAEPATARTN
ncbi:MAG TPA: hypothetical protein VMF57_20075 [Solirubrobacteraceae bacterium]|nr:hypothetical protein [Solirubrobacteraceae bacterium]